MRRTWEKKSGWEASRGEGVEGACGWLEGERFTLTEWRRAQGSAPNCVRGGVPFGVPNTQGGGPSIRHGMSASEIIERRRRLRTEPPVGHVWCLVWTYIWFSHVLGRDMDASLAHSLTCLHQWISACSCTSAPLNLIAVHSRPNTLTQTHTVGVTDVALIGGHQSTSNCLLIDWSCRDVAYINCQTPSIFLQSVVVIRHGKWV